MMSASYFLVIGASFFRHAELCFSIQGAAGDGIACGEMDPETSSG
jgi:hypothetical protein